MKIEAEQILLIILFLLLGAGSITLGVLYSTPENNVSTVTKNQVPDFDPVPYDPLPESIRTIPPWKESLHKVFVPPLMGYYLDTGIVKRIKLEDKDKYGITGTWKKKYGFPLDDPDVALQDPDNDGFTNLEEFNAGTDPRDPNSTPASIGKLRMQSYVSSPLLIKFMGYSKEADGNWALQLNFNGSSKLVHEGDHFDLGKMKISNTGWRIGPFRQIIKKEKSPFTDEIVDVDYSELDFHHPRLDDRVVTLVRNKASESDDKKVTFIALLPNPPKLVVQLGEKFDFHGVQYQLMEASKDKALLKNSSTGETHTVPLMNDEDKEKYKVLLAPPEKAPTEGAPAASSENSADH